MGRSSNTGKIDGGFDDLTVTSVLPPGLSWLSSHLNSLSVSRIALALCSLAWYREQQHKTGFPGPLASVLSLLAPGFDHGPFGGFHFHRNEKSRCLSSEGRTHYDVVEKGFYPSRCSFYGCLDGRNLSLVGEGKSKKTWCLGAYR